MAGLVFIAILLLVTAAVREVRARREFAADGPAFRCRFRRHGPAPAGWPRLRRRWSRPMWARWAGDMLVIRRGPVGDRTLRLIAKARPAGVYFRPGTEDIAMKLSIEGANVELTAAATDRLEMVGPFLAAAIRDLPEAPTRRYRV